MASFKMKHFTCLQVIVLFLMNQKETTGGTKVFIKSLVAADKSRDNIGSGSRLFDNRIPHVTNPPKDMKPPTFAAVIYRKSEAVGSGAIISKYFVLTLCTVVKPQRSSKLNWTYMTRVQYPFFDTPDDETNTTFLNAVKIIYHLNCRTSTGANIGLVKTNEAMLERGYLKYAKLPNRMTLNLNGNYMLSNFRPNNRNAMNIQQAIWFVITKRINDRLCKKILEDDQEEFLPQGTICAAYLHIGDGSNCKTDDGQPLSFRKNNEDILIGLNTHHHQCGRAKEAASYVSIMYHLDWIEKQTKS